MQTHHRLRRHAVVNECSQIHPKARAAQADPASGRALSALRPQGRSLSFRRWSQKAAKRLVTALHARRQSRKPGKRRRARHRNCRTAGLNAGARKGAAKKPFPKTRSPVSSRKTGPLQPMRQANYEVFAPAFGSPGSFLQEGFCHRHAATRASLPHGSRGSGFSAVNEWQNAKLKRHSSVRKR